MQVSLSGYQDFVKGMTLPSADNLEYGVANLAGEAGEVASVYAKALRDVSNGSVQHVEVVLHRNDAMKKELGDVFFMLAHLCNQCGFTLEEVAVANIRKLQDRKDRKVLGGSGDSR